MNVANQDGTPTSRSIVSKARAAGGGETLRPGEEPWRKSKPKPAVTAPKRKPFGTTHPSYVEPRPGKPRGK
jgi:hypothetical protein